MRDVTDYFLSVYVKLFIGILAKLKLMPLTPFHFGPALFFGLLLFRYINLPTFLIANVIIDIEPFLVLILGLNYPLHGLSHSFLVGALVAVVLSLFMIKLNERVEVVMASFKLKQNSSPRIIGIASILGIYLHILFDSPLYTDIRPFYPSDFNPFYNNSIFIEMYLLCVLLFIAGLFIYGYRFWFIEVR